MKAEKINEDDSDFNEVDSALDQLRAIASEHFEAGVFMLSRVKDGKTSYHGTEFGNKFAIQGMVTSYSNGELNEDFDEDTDEGAED